jgi:hypothetical protein
MNEAALRSVVDEAKTGGVRVIAHIADTGDLEAALTAGVRAFAHVPLADRVSTEQARRMAELGVFVVPTAAVQDALWRSSEAALTELQEPEIVDDVPADTLEALRKSYAKPQSSTVRNRRKLVRDNVLANVKTLHQAGVRVVTGTDSGVYAALFGRAMQREVALYVEAGLTVEHALASATSVPAEVLGRADLGRITAGAAADLLVVDGDVTRDVAALARVARVYVRGALVDRDAIGLTKPATLERAKIEAGAGKPCITTLGCGSGLVCSALDETCRARCTSPAGCSDGASCVPESTSLATCMAGHGCDPLRQDCRNGTACIFGANGATFCWFAASAQPGERCPQGACAPGSQCDPQRGICRKLCDPREGACAEQKACEDFSALAGRPVGLCVE